MNAKMQARIEQATVRFPDRGQGVIVPGQMIVTAAHVCVGWSIEGGLAYDDPCLQTVLIGGQLVEGRHPRHRAEVRHRRARGSG